MRRSSALWRSSRWTLPINALVVVVVVSVVVLSGTMDSSNLTLVFMGFDLDRAQLITSLLVASAAAAAATLITNKRGEATLAGLGGLAALFGHTFLVETRNALASTGADGSFDLLGWLATLLTLLTAGLIASWVGAVLSGAIRPGLIGAGSAIREAFGSRRINRRLLRGPISVGIVLTLLVVTVPVFGDMVNYTPDSRMLQGGAPPVGLIRGQPTASAAPASNSPSAGPTPNLTQASPTPEPTPSPLPNERPWLAWRPSGKGVVWIVNLPAPWRDNSGLTENVDVYTPPGYDSHGTRRYPVLYEAPFDYPLWASSVNISVALDTMIDRGTVPAMIVVFINAWRAPIYDTECANSVDGRQWFDTFISQTVVSYVDSHYRTIAAADARAFTGFSQGGYCAAILPLRHPTVFSTAIPISGYFEAGEGDASSKLPFGGVAAALAAASPMVVASDVPADQRGGLFFIVIAKPTEPFFGPQATGFEQLLAVDGYNYVALDDQLGHGWTEVRQELPAGLEAWAAHLVTEGVFQG